MAPFRVQYEYSNTIFYDIYISRISDKSSFWNYKIIKIIHESVENNNFMTPIPKFQD